MGNNTNSNENSLPTMGEDVEGTTFQTELTDSEWNEMYDLAQDYISSVVEGNQSQEDFIESVVTERYNRETEEERIQRLSEQLEEARQANREFIGTLTDPEEIENNRYYGQYAFDGLLDSLENYRNK